MFLGQAPQHVRAASLQSPQVCLSDCVGQCVDVCDFSNMIDLAHNVAFYLPPHWCSFTISSALTSLSPFYPSLTTEPCDRL